MVTSQTTIKSYAGIGSRNTPEDVLKLMKEIGMYLATKGFILRSGHAVGADTAFEKGCDAKKGKKEIFFAYQAKNDQAALDLAASVHPAWNKCTEYAQLLHARNGYIILGKDLKSPVNYVICYQDERNKYGGTWQGIKIARSKGIRVYNLWRPKTRKAIEDRINEIKKEAKDGRVSK